ncbi:MAG: TonB-dependent receptor, partial [Amphiplicatus sp.]
TAKAVQVPSSIGVDADMDGIAETFAGLTTNAAAATLWGAEWEGNLGLARDWLSPGDALDYQFSLGYINASFDEFIGRSPGPGLPPADLSDLAVFQNTPEVTAFSKLSYTKPMNLFESGAATIYSSFSYRSLTNQFSYPIAALDQPGFVLFNAGLTWTSDDGRLSAGVHGTNLLDKKYIVAGYDFVSVLPEFSNTALGTTGVLTAFYGNPRQVFGTVKVAF